MEDGLTGRPSVQGQISAGSCGTGAATSTFLTWVGETEAAIRDVFERAQKFAPKSAMSDSWLG